MGLIGLMVTLVLLGLGMGYYYFGVSGMVISVTNDESAPVTQGSGLYEDLKTEANDIKAAVEKRAENEMKAGEGMVDVPATTPVIPPAVTNQTSASGIIDRLMSMGFAVPKKARTIDTIVLHSSYNPNGGDPYDVSALVKIYESYGVSAHYLIDRGGKIYQLVNDANIAYHAGVSKMPDGRQDVNNFSIGIEIMNQEDTSFTNAQYEAVNALITSLKKQYSIKNVVGHSDIAPGRKTDPWNFDWKKLK